jgi:hypothetical protein
LWRKQGSLAGAVHAKSCKFGAGWGKSMESCGICDMAMSQYLLIPFLVGWTSIYQLFWGSLGTRVLTHPHMRCWWIADFRLIFCWKKPWTLRSKITGSGLRHVQTFQLPLDSGRPCNHSSHRRSQLKSMCFFLNINGVSRKWISSDQVGQDSRKSRWDDELGIISSYRKTAMAAMAAMVELGWPIWGWSIGGTNPISKAENVQA